MSDSRLDIRSRSPGTVHTDDPACRLAWCREGWYTEIRHPGPITTRYCHLLHRPSVIVGQQVTAGQAIGVVGTSGHSTGPHLHWETHQGHPATEANAIDPADFLRSVGVAVDT
jgi:murein DD-endopeptidase MepM/ murein hydrolase activator NlpD